MLFTILLKFLCKPQLSRIIVKVINLTCFCRKCSVGACFFLLHYSYYFEAYTPHINMSSCVWDGVCLGEMRSNYSNITLRKKSCKLFYYIIYHIGTFLNFIRFVILFLFFYKFLKEFRILLVTIYLSDSFCKRVVTKGSLQIFR